MSAEMRPGVWHILDPDFGVHVPLSLAELETDPEKALPYYDKTPLYRIPLTPRRYMLDTVFIRLVWDRGPEWRSRRKADKLRWAGL